MFKCWNLTWVRVLNFEKWRCCRRCLWDLSMSDRAINKKKNPNLARVPDGIVVSHDIHLSIHLSIASLMAVGSWNIDKDIQSWKSSDSALTRVKNSTRHFLSSIIHQPTIRIATVGVCGPFLICWIHWPWSPFVYSIIDCWIVVITESRLVGTGQCGCVCVRALGKNKQRFLVCVGRSWPIDRPMWEILKSGWIHDWLVNSPVPHCRNPH